MREGSEGPVTLAARPPLGLVERYLHLNAHAATLDDLVNEVRNDATSYKPQTIDVPLALGYT